MMVTLGRLGRLLAASAAITGMVFAAGCSNRDAKADATPQTAENTQKAASAGVNNAGSESKTSKPPFDPSK